LINKGKTSVLEIDEFFELRFGEDKMSVSKQNVSKQRSYLSPLIFKDADKNGLKEIYSEELTDLKKFKGYFLLNVDGSQFDIPNTPITIEKFEVKPRALKKMKVLKYEFQLFPMLKMSLSLIPLFFHSIVANTLWYLKILKTPAK